MEFHLKEGAEINMFVHDHRLNPKVPQPISFDGVKFMLLFTAAASSKDVIMFTGVLSDLVEHQKREADNIQTQSENMPDEGNDLTAEMSTLKNQFKADFLRYTLLHATSGDPNVMVGRIMKTSNSDSGAVTGLEIWRHMTSFRMIRKNQDGIIAQADHVTCRVECLKIKGCHSTVLSMKEFQTQSRSPWQFRKSEAILLSP